MKKIKVPTTNADELTKKEAYNNSEWNKKKVANRSSAEWSHQDSYKDEYECEGDADANTTTTPTFYAKPGTFSYSLDQPTAHRIKLKPKSKPKTIIKEVQEVKTKTPKPKGKSSKNVKSLSLYEANQHFEKILSTIYGKHHSESTSRVKIYQEKNTKTKVISKISKKKTKNLNADVVSGVEAVSVSVSDSAPQQNLSVVFHSDNNNNNHESSSSTKIAKASSMSRISICTNTNTDAGSSSYSLDMINDNNHKEFYQTLKPKPKSYPNSNSGRHAFKTETKLAIHPVGPRCESLTEENSSEPEIDGNLKINLAELEYKTQDQYSNNYQFRKQFKNQIQNDCHCIHSNKQSGYEEPFSNTDFDFNGNRIPSIELNGSAQRLNQKETTRCQLEQQLFNEKIKEMKINTESERSLEIESKDFTTEVIFTESHDECCGYQCQWSRLSDWNHACKTICHDVEYESTSDVDADADADANDDANATNCRYLLNEVELMSTSTSSSKSVYSNISYPSYAEQNVIIDALLAFPTPTKEDNNNNNSIDQKITTCHTEIKISTSTSTFGSETAFENQSNNNFTGEAGEADITHKESSSDITLPYPMSTSNERDFYCERKHRSSKKTTGEDDDGTGTETSESVKVENIHIRPDSVHKMLLLQNEILSHPDKYNDSDKYDSFDLKKRDYNEMEKYIKYQIFYSKRRDQMERRTQRQRQLKQRKRQKQKERRKSRNLLLSSPTSSTSTSSDSDSVDEHPKPSQLRSRIRRRKSLTDSGKFICNRLKHFWSLTLSPMNFCFHWRRNQNQNKNQCKVCPLSEDEEVDLDASDAGYNESDTCETSARSSSTTTTTTNGTYKRRKQLQYEIEGRLTSSSSSDADADADTDTDNEDDNDKDKDTTTSKRSVTRTNATKNGRSEKSVPVCN